MDKTEVKPRYNEAQILERAKKLDFTQWATVFNTAEIAILTKALQRAGAVKKPASSYKALPVDHMIGALKSSKEAGSSDAVKAIRILVSSIPGLIEKGVTFDLRVDHRGYGFCRLNEQHRKNAEGKTVKVDDFPGVGSLESVRLADSFK